MEIKGYRELISIVFHRGEWEHLTQIPLAFWLFRYDHLFMLLPQNSQGDTVWDESVFSNIALWDVDSAWSIHTREV